MKLHLNGISIYLQLISTKFQKFPKEYGKWVSDWQSNTTQALKQSTKNRTTDTWYEQATNRSTKDLSYEYLSELDYYISYDEPSN